MAEQEGQEKTEVPTEKKAQGIERRRTGSL
jgi:hypothetical protein